MSDFQKLKERVIDLEKEIKENKSVLNDRIDVLDNDLQNLKQQIQNNRQQVDKHIKNQEEIIMDMINKFNEQFLTYKNKFLSDIDDLKTQQDILKISYSVNEKRLLEKINQHIRDELKEVVKSKEKEVLMSIWIEELGDIMNNFENFKKIHPREFKTQLKEISDTIKHFKQQISQ